MIDQIKKYLIYVLAALAVIWVAVGTNQYSSYKRFVLEDYSCTVGKIEEFTNSGGVLKENLRYSYKVSGIPYERLIAPDVYFEECIGFGQCPDMEFYVIYSNKDSSKSLINLNNSFNGCDQLVVVEDNFE